MKRILLLAIFILNVVQIVSADDLVVNTLLFKPTDLTASTHPRLDVNGKPCGLLKVITTDDTMTFEGAVIGPVEYRDGEYWVYLPEGTYLLRIKSIIKESVMLNFNNYNISNVISKGTYELTFRSVEYPVIDLKRLEHKIIEGPKLKKYAVSIITLPEGWEVQGLSTLDYLKGLSYIIAHEGDGFEHKHNCTIIANYFCGYVESYTLIIESTDNEDAAIERSGAGYGGFETSIYVVEQ